MAEQATKICAICGEDCSKQRRVKDNKGRYYHKECVDKARREQKKQSQDSLGSAAVIAPPPEENRAGEYAVVETEVEDGVPASPHTEAIPVDDADQYVVEEDGPPPSGDLSGLGGGPAVDAGQPASSTRIASVPTRYSGEGGRIWPPVVGVISILLGVGEVVIFGLAPIRDVIAGEIRIVPLVVAALAMLLGLWLLIGGFGILTRQQTAMIIIQKWAKLKILFSILLVGGGIAAVLLDLPLLDQFDQQFIIEAREKSIGPLITSGVLYLLLLLIWPLFVAIWFSRGKTQEDIGFWR
ncbi:MAG: hypothetical protein JSV91_00050 [Phycisphaerales bacterium]|nr:MAG: hypothetical protein JSV91_00050 [Phycisphaerales bacterium]